MKKNTAYYILERHNDEVNLKIRKDLKKHFDEYGIEKQKLNDKANLEIQKELKKHFESSEYTTNSKNLGKCDISLPAEGSGGNATLPSSEEQLVYSMEKIVFNSINSEKIPNVKASCSECLNRVSKLSESNTYDPNALNESLRVAKKFEKFEKSLAERAREEIINSRGVGSVKETAKKFAGDSAPNPSPSPGLVEGSFEQKSLQLAESGNGTIALPPLPSKVDIFISQQKQLKETLTVEEIRDNYTATISDEIMRNANLVKNLPKTLDYKEKLKNFPYDKDNADIDSFTYSYPPVPLTRVTQNGQLWNPSSIKSDKKVDPEHTLSDEKVPNVEETSEVFQSLVQNMVDVFTPKDDDTALLIDIIRGFTSLAESSETCQLLVFYAMENVFAVVFGVTAFARFYLSFTSGGIIPFLFSVNAKLLRVHCARANRQVFHFIRISVTTIVKYGANVFVPPLLERGSKASADVFFEFIEDKIFSKPQIKDVSKTAAEISEVVDKEAQPKLVNRKKIRKIETAFQIADETSGLSGGGSFSYENETQEDTK